MAKFTVNNTGAEIECKKWELKDAIECMPNLLETSETNELLSYILDMMSQKQLESTLNFICERFPAQTSLRLEECGLIEEE